jgi:hypothetical protein
MEGNVFTLCLILFPSAGWFVYWRQPYAFLFPAEYWKEATLVGHVIIPGTVIVHITTPHGIHDSLISLVYPSQSIRFLEILPSFQMMTSVVSSLILFPPRFYVFGMWHV